MKALEIGMILIILLMITGVVLTFSEDLTGKVTKTQETHHFETLTSEVVDNLITNFHLPESTLIMLVSALAGKDNIMNAYNQAVKEKYRFFSFGDAMYIKD